MNNQSTSRPGKRRTTPLAMIAGSCFTAATMCAQLALAKPEKPVFSDLPPEGQLPGGAETTQSGGPYRLRPGLTSSSSATFVAQANTSPRPSDIDQAEAAHKDMEARLGGKKLYRFKAEDLDLKTALSMLARDNNLNIVPDHDVNGVVTLDVHDLPLDMMMKALLEASDCSWREEGGLIRVRNCETRTFTVDYL